MPSLSSITPPGARFRRLVDERQPLQVVGAINAYCALLAEKAGHEALYLSGAGVANASFGLPDLGMTQLSDVAEDAQRITSVSDLPLLVDIDTGFGGALNIARTIQVLERCGVAAVHIEDQVQAKRCGHRPNKAIVSTEEMSDRIKASVDARHDASFVIMARTDAFANEGMQGAIERSLAYVEAGADMIFAEALSALDDFETFCAACPVPVLANITEFGRTPLLSTDALNKAGVGLALYPLSAFRAMSQAALSVYQTLAEHGTQSELLDAMQTREALYEVLDYHAFERKLDALNDQETP